MGQFRALMVLSREEPLAVTQLGERLGVGVPAASKVVDRLVQSALAERWEDPADRRRALVRLTERGRESMEQMQQGREMKRGHMRLLMGRLAEEDLIHLQLGLRALAAAADEDLGGGA